MPCLRHNVDGWLRLRGFKAGGGFGQLGLEKKQMNKKIIAARKIGFSTLGKTALAAVALTVATAGRSLAVDDALTEAITGAMTVAKTNVTSILVAGVALLALGMLWRFIKSGSKKVSL